MLRVNVKKTKMMFSSENAGKATKENLLAETTVTTSSASFAEVACIRDVVIL